METALVFDREGDTLHWHEPLGRSGGSLPDSRDLWEVLWEHRSKGGTGRLAGVAHTHPWKGQAWASGTDLTTFRAVELGLGELLLWPIVTFTDVLYLCWNPVTEEYVRANSTIHLRGLEELRARSN